MFGRQNKTLLTKLFGAFQTKFYNHLLKKSNNNELNESTNDPERPILRGI